MHATAAENTLGAMNFADDNQPIWPVAAAARLFAVHLIDCQKGKNRGTAEDGRTRCPSAHLNSWLTLAWPAQRGLDSGPSFV